jgi:hypothetical protein
VFPICMCFVPLSFKDIVVFRPLSFKDIVVKVNINSAKIENKRLTLQPVGKWPC